MGAPPHRPVQALGRDFLGSALSPGTVLSDRVGWTEAKAMHPPGCCGSFKHEAQDFLALPRNGEAAVRFNDFFFLKIIIIIEKKKNVEGLG